jgi:hypothetical protein
MTVCCRRAPSTPAVGASRSSWSSMKVAAAISSRYHTERRRTPVRSVPHRMAASNSATEHSGTVIIYVMGTNIVFPVPDRQRTHHKFCVANASTTAFAFAGGVGAGKGGLSEGLEKSAHERGFAGAGGAGEEADAAAVGEVAIAVIGGVQLAALVAFALSASRHGGLHGGAVHGEACGPNLLGAAGARTKRKRREEDEDMYADLLNKTAQTESTFTPADSIHHQDGARMHA